MPNIFRNYALILGGATLLLSASVALAQDRQDGLRLNVRNENRAQSDRSDARSYATSTKMMERLREKGEDMRQKAEKHMEQIKDKKKQEGAKNLSRQFDKQNQNWTKHFTKLLDKYTTILQKVKDRSAAAALAGKDITATNAAISTAQAAIATARAAVVAQQAKTYVVNLTIASSVVTTATSTPKGQEEIMKGLKSAFQILKKQLFDSLFALRDGVMKDARKSVQDAVQTLGKIPGVDEIHATSTVKAEKENN